jgi:hypothetical protein
MGFESDGLNHPGTMIIGPAKSADKDHDVKVFQTHFTMNQRIYVNKAWAGAGKPKGMGGLMVAVESITRKN